MKLATILIASSLAAILAIGISSLIGTALINNSITEIVNHENPKVQSSFEIEISAEKAAKDLFTFLEVESSDYKMAFNENISQLETFEKLYRNSVRTDKEKEALDRLHELTVDFERTGNKLIVAKEDQIKKRIERAALLDNKILLVIDDQLQKNLNVSDPDFSRKQVALLKMELSLQEQTVHMRGYLLKLETTKDNVNNSVRDFFHWQEQFTNTRLSSQEANLVAEIENDYKTVETITYEILALEDEQQKLLGQLNGNMIQIDRILDEELQVIALETIRADEVAATTVSNWTLLAVSILLPSAAVATVFIARSITKPIGKLRDVSTEIAKGNLQVRAEPEGSEELSSLAHSFNHMAEKLHETELAKDEFSSMITHELKTPLVPIRGYCEMLMDGIYGELTSKQKERVKIIHRNAISLLRLIQDILDSQKLELRKMKIDMKNVPAEYLIDTCVNTFLPAAQSKNVRLMKEVEGKLRLKCDPGRILQVLNNLTSNALKFVEEQTGTIEISAKRYNGSALFTVKDNGIGIPKEKQGDLFRKFYQVDTSLARSAGGTGLGLAISRGIINEHNGEIWVESEEGKGTTFYFTIPLENFETTEITEPKAQ